MELKRIFENFVGRIFGYDRCVFCGDRSNWKSWAGNLDIDDKRTGECVCYEIPVCEDCFNGRHIDDVIFAIKKDIADYNNINRKFTGEPYYSDEEQELIIDSVKVLKS